VVDVSRCVEFTQRLIQTESLPGREGKITELVRREMETLGYDEVHTDEAGNLFGLVKGRGEAPAVMFNTHLDHVDVGDPSRWPYPPFGSEIHDGKIWGRGAMDIKGPLAAQVYGVGQLVAEGTRPPGDVYVSGTVQEEIGGLGARHVITYFSVPLVVIGEASSNQLRRGHRGRIELVLHVLGKSVHASIPRQGVNPLEVVARFILRLQELKLHPHPDLGPSSVAPTLIRTDQTSANVIPAEAWLTCDWRNVAGETAEDVRKILLEVAESCYIEGAKAVVEIPSVARESYTGYKADVPADFPSFITPADHPAVLGAQRILGNAIGLEEPPAVWRFATDGGHFAKAGMTVIGFGPGDETLAHTVQEHIEISALETAMAGNRALALEWAAAVEHEKG
jgi:succinyl-diaminopimelate desuccinylase